MPNTYRVTDPVTGVTLDLQGDSPPTEEELTGIFKQYEKPSEIPQRRGVEQFTGAGREVSPAMSMLTPEQKKEALKTGIQTTAGMVAGPIAGTLLRGATSVPSLVKFGSAIESGGLAPSLNWLQRLGGGAVSGGISGAVMGDPITGAEIGMVTPTAARALRPILSPIGPTTADRFAQSQEKYQSVKDLNKSVTPETFNSLLGRLNQTANEFQYLPSMHPKVTRALGTFEEQAAKGEVVPIDRLDKLRQRLGQAVNSKDFDEREMAKKMIGEVDTFIQQQSPEAAQNLEKARELYTQVSRSKIVDRIISQAKASRSKEPSQFIQDSFRKIAEGEGKYAAVKRQFTPEQQKLIADIGNGSLSISALEKVGENLAPMIGPTISKNDLAKMIRLGSGYATLGTYVGPQVAGPIAAALTTTGLGSRALANRLAMVRAQRLGAMTRGNGLMAERFRPDLLPQFAPIIGINAMQPNVDFASQSAALNALDQ